MKTKKIECPEHLKEKEKEIVKLIETGKISEGLKEAFKCGLAKVEFRTNQQCKYCGRMIDIKKFEKHLCKGLKKIKLLMYYTPGLMEREAIEILYAGEVAEENKENSKNAIYDKMLEIMKKRKLKFRKEDKKC